MITINTLLTKSEFLSKLLQLAHAEGDQIVVVESLPTFMDTLISLRLLAYQLQSYPRPIKWVVEDELTQELFQQAQLETVAAIPIIQTITNDSTHSELTNKSPQLIFPAESKIESQEETVLNGFNFDQSISQSVYSPSPLIAGIEQLTEDETTKDSIQASDNSSQSVPKYDVRHTTNSVFLDLSAPLATDDSNKKSYDSKTNSALKNNSLSLQEELTSSIQSESSSKNQSTQNLDIWLERISASKDAITSLRKQPSTNQQLQVVGEDNHQLASASTAHNPQKNTNWLQSIIPRSRSSALYTGVFCVFAILLIGLFFPANVYTLKIEAPQFQDSITLEFNEKEFQQTNTLIEAESLIDATGSAVVPTVRSIGTVSLLNYGNRGVDLTNGKFLLLGEENQEYSVVYNATLPQVFAIPARNDLNGPQIQFEIQSNGVGENYNTKAGSRFSIVNLKGERVCGTCYAVASTDIMSLSDAGEKTASQADYNILQNTVDGNLGIQIQKKIESKQSDNGFTHSEWFRNTNSTYNYSPSLGQVTDKVELNAQVTSIIYYLTRDQVVQKIQDTRPDLFSVESTAIISTDGVIESVNSIVSVQFAYSYTNEAPVEMSQVKQYLRNKDCDKGSLSVSKAYPGVQALDCRITGIDLPGIPKSIDITVVEE